MTRTVTVYRDTDSSAPVLTGTAGDLVNLLDKVLVTGYGSKPAAGWTKPYTGTNKAAFRNDTTDGSGVYYRVQDDLTSTAQRFSYMNMYETMSAIDTGTNPFPTTVPSGGVQKSNTQDSTPRPWVIVADNCAAHILIKHGANGTEWEHHFIGDIFSYKPSDAYRGCLIERISGSTLVSSLTYTNNTTPRNLAFGVTDAGIGLVRAHTGSGSAIAAGLHTDAEKINTNLSSASGAYFGGSANNVLAYPNAINSGLFLAPIWIHQGTASPYILRGYIPGLWAPLHNRPLGNNDTFSGSSGQLSGRTFEAFNVYSGAQILIETSNTWS